MQPDVSISSRSSHSSHSAESTPHTLTSHSRRRHHSHREAARVAEKAFDAPWMKMTDAERLKLCRKLTAECDDDPKLLDQALRVANVIKDERTKAIAVLEIFWRDPPTVSIDINTGVVDMGVPVIAG